MKPSTVRKCIVLLSAVILIVACTAAVRMSDEEENPVIISEVCTGNVSAASDPNGRYRNYVELYNASDEDMDLSEWYLADSKKKKKREKLDGVVIAAHGYVLIWMGEKEDEEGSSSGEIFPNEVTFDLDSTGGSVMLSDGSGHIRDTVRVPYLKYNTSYSMMDGHWQVSTSTPGSDNSAAQILHRITLSEPSFSKESGFYDDDFLLELSAEPGQEIWYTTDGSDPDPDADTCFKYDGALEITNISSTPNHYSAITNITALPNYTPDEPVDKAVVIRAIAYDPSTGEESRTVTNTYFVGYEGRKDYEDVPVVSLVSDPVNLFDYNCGIYIAGERLDEYAAIGGFEGMDPSEMPSHFTIDDAGNVTWPDDDDEEQNDAEDDGEDKARREEKEEARSEQGSVLENSNRSGGDGKTYWRYEWTNAQIPGRTSERAASISYFDKDHNLSFTQDVGIRIAGESSRSALQKSLNVYARKAYDEESGGYFSYHFFLDKPVTKFRLRHADTNGFSLDAFLMSLAGDRAVGIERAIPTAVFLNGEYWGIYYLREQYTRDYFENYYGTNPDNLWVMKNYDAAIGSSECVHDYDVMIQQMTIPDMSDPVEYGVVERNINLESLIDWYCINLYADNEDTGSWHNIERWRTKEAEDSEYGDGRWNSVLYDMDESCGYGQGGTDASVDTIEVYKNIDERLYLPGYLSANEDFRRQYCVTMMDIANTTYSYERVHQKLEEWKSTVRLQAIDSIHRFRTDEGAEEIFEENIERIDAFFKDRRYYMEQYLREDQTLTGDIVKVNVKAKVRDDGDTSSDEAGGTVKVNSSVLYQDEAAEGWTGEYFSDFDITLTAEPLDDYKFAGWEIQNSDGSIRKEEESELVLDLTGGDVQVTAIFEED